jgi:hypothetical protein
MTNFPEKENSEWTLKKTILRVFAYLFCVFLIGFGVDTLINSPHTGKDLLRNSGEIVAGCVYLFVDIRILIKKSKRTKG